MVTRVSTLLLCLFFTAAVGLFSGCGHKYEDQKTGLTVRDLGSDLDNHWAFKGVVVEAVRSGSPADGLIVAGELISYVVDERSVTSEKTYRKALREALDDDDNAMLRMMKTVTATTQEDLGIQVKPDPEESGVIVDLVNPNSKAEEAGLKLETIIHGINGKSTKSIDEYAVVLAESLAGGELTFDITRRIVAPKLSKVGIEELEERNGKLIVAKMKESSSETNSAGMEGVMKGDIITHVIDEIKITDIDSFKKAIEKAVDADRVIIKRGELGGIKLAAIEALGQIGDLRAVDPLLKSLESEDKWVRRAAAKALEEMEDKTIIQPLMRHLLLENEDDAEVRRSAAKALARMHPVEAIESLAQALKDPSLGVRLDAGYALGRIGEPAIDVLVKARHDEDSKVRDSAVAALGNIGGKEVISQLISILRDENEEPTVKLTAIQALYKLGDSESIAELQRVASIGEPGLQAFVKELLAEET